MANEIDFGLTPIGSIESRLSKVKEARCQGSLGAPEAIHGTPVVDVKPVI